MLVMRSLFYDMLLVLQNPKLSLIVDGGMECKILGYFEIKVWVSRIVRLVDISFIAVGYSGLDLCALMPLIEAGD